MDINNNDDIHVRNFEEGLFQSCLEAGSVQNRDVVFNGIYRNE
ncbi:hypothetical protein NC651_038823 [Populus alba x Populus x berolinensis]|nr:hypothetical protein NC651_038823 [Populus alba x Populus x berolinensis]